MAVKKRANRRNAAEVTADGVDTATGATTGSNDNNDANEATEPNDAPNQRSENSTKSTAIQHLYSRITLLFLQIYFYFYNFLSFGIYAKVDRGSQFSNRILILGDENALGVGDEAGFMTRKGLVKYLVRKLHYEKNIRQTWEFAVEAIEKSTADDWINPPTAYISKIISNPLYSSPDCKIIIILLSGSHTSASFITLVEKLEEMGKQVFVTLLPSTPDSLRAYVLKKDLKGVDISPSNYEYKGSFIWNGEYLSRRGYEKLAKDYVEVLGNEMIKIEFAKFKLRLGM